MVSMFASSAVDREFGWLHGKIKYEKFGIFCFSGNKSKTKDKLAGNHDNVSKWGDIFTRGL